MKNLQKNLSIIWQSSSPHFALPSPPFLEKFFRTPPFPSILGKLNPSLYQEGGRFKLWGGFTLCLVTIGTLSHPIFKLPYNPVPYFESKYHPLILIVTVYADWCKGIALP